MSRLPSAGVDANQPLQGVLSAPRTDRIAFGRREAAKRAGNLDSDKLVAAMEATDYVGTIGRVQFLPQGDPHVHGLKTGAGFITGLMLQWQNGVQVNVRPAALANGKLEFPSFVKIASGGN